jgi:hypothetical protein
MPNIEWIKDDPDVIGRGVLDNDGEVVVVTAPAVSIGGDGPEIIPGFGDNRVVVVWATEYIDDLIARALDEDFGVDEHGVRVVIVSILLRTGIELGIAWLAHDAT